MALLFFYQKDLITGTDVTFEVVESVIAAGGRCVTEPTGTRHMLHIFRRSDRTTCSSTDVIYRLWIFQFFSLSNCRVETDVASNADGQRDHQDLSFVFNLLYIGRGRERERERRVFNIPIMQLLVTYLISFQL